MKGDGSTRADLHAMSWSTPRDVFRPIYVTEITQNFPENLFLPLVSVKYDDSLGNTVGKRPVHYGHAHSGSIDIEDVFAWVYDDDLTARLLENAER